MSPNWGGHTAFPVLGMKIADWASNTKGRTRDVVVLVSESIANECREFRHATFMVDITTETRPFSVATYSAGVQGQLLPPGWALRPALEQRIVRADLLSQDGLRRLLQRRRARGRHPRPLRAARGGLLHPVDHRAHRQALRDRTAPAPARWRSRPTTSKSTSGASSTSRTAPTPACTSSASPARRRARRREITRCGAWNRPPSPSAARRRPGGAVAPLDTATQAARSRRPAADRRRRG